LVEVDTSKQDVYFRFWANKEPVLGDERVVAPREGGGGRRPVVPSGVPGCGTDCDLCMATR